MASTTSRVPPGKTKLGFKLTGTASDEGDTIFTFTSPVDVFPQRIVYRHTKAGSLYAEVEGQGGRSGQGRDLPDASGRLRNRQAGTRIAWPIRRPPRAR